MLAWSSSDAVWNGESYDHPVLHVMCRTCRTLRLLVDILHDTRLVPSVSAYQVIQDFKGSKSTAFGAERTM